MLEACFTYLFNKIIVWQFSEISVYDFHLEFIVKFCNESKKQKKKNLIEFSAFSSFKRNIWKHIFFALNKFLSLFLPFSHTLLSKINIVITEDYYIHTRIYRYFLFEMVDLFSKPCSQNIYSVFRFFCFFFHIYVLHKNGNGNLDHERKLLWQHKNWMKWKKLVRRRIFETKFSTTLPYNFDILI